MRPRSFSVSLAPSGRYVPDSSTRRSFDCSSIGSSAISSRKSVPSPTAVKNPSCRLSCPSEGAALVAEELRLDQRPGEGAAVEIEERLGRIAAERVDRPHDQLLAGAGGTGDERRALREGDALDHVAKSLHRRRRCRRGPCSRRPPGARAGRRTSRSERARAPGGPWRIGRTISSLSSSFQ